MSQHNNNDDDKQFQKLVRIKHIDDDTQQRLNAHIEKISLEVVAGSVTALLTVVFNKDGTSYHLGTCTNRDQQISGLFQMAVNTTLME